MAIIKCPECGHQTSDKAPVCPNCGVEIAGKIIKCPYCGEIYLISEIVCPHCHKSPSNGNNPIENDNQSLVEQNSTNVERNSYLTSDNGIIVPTKDESSNSLNTTPQEQYTTPNDNTPKARKNNRTTLIVSLIIAVLALGVCFYFYNRAQSEKEMEEYNFALSSEDPTILQEYLNNFKDAPQEHIDSIKAHLQRLEQLDQDWTNAIVSGSKSALMDYLSKHPDSPHKQEAMDKIDSIDWAQCLKLNTSEAYQMYMADHSDGNHYEEAQIALKKIKANTVSMEERQAISNLFHNFFVSINERDEINLVSNINDNINFLGKQNATKQDIIYFMNRLYKQDVQNMVWSISGDYNIQKKEIGDEQYEYIVNFMANQKVEKVDEPSANYKYKINARINPDGKMTEMSMTRINE